MFERFTRKSMATTGAALLAALGVAGVASAAAGNSSTPSTPKVQSTPAQSNEKPGVESNAPENSAKDPDSVQYTAPGDADAGSAAAGRTAAASSTAASESTTEAPGTEQSPASEQPGSETPGSEVSNNDGPGGHADEPGNPNADHQFQGKE